MATYLLPALIAVPALGALIAAFAGNDAQGQRRLGLLISAIVAVLGCGLLCAPTQAFSVAWFTLWGSGATVHFSLANDGLSAWLVQLATWLTPLVILGATAAVGARMREFVVCVLAMQALMIGALLARDVVLFVLCYEGMLIPMLVLIALFGGYERRLAAMTFFLYTMAGSIFLLVGVWWLASAMGTTDLPQVIAKMATLTTEQKYWLFWAFVLAFAVKVPLIPLHGWQATTYEHTPGAANALLAGVMAKIGIYGLIRFVLPMFPEQCAAYSTLFITLGVAATVGGAVVAIVQDDAKRMIAYSSLSHLGLVVAGIFTFQTSAMQGAAVQMVAHGLSVAALFLLISYLENRTRMYGLYDFGALAGRMPRLAVLFVAAALAAAGLPGTANFVGEFLLLIGLFQGSGVWVAAIAGLSVILTVVYLLILIQRWFFGSNEPSTRAQLHDLGPGEMLAVVPLLLASVVLGCWATPITSSAGAVAAASAKPALAALAKRAATTTPQPAPAVPTHAAPAKH